MTRLLPVTAIAAALFLSVPAAQADVVAKSEIGFVSRNTVEVAAKPDAVWNALVAPSGWWNPQHTYSGDSANLSIEPQVGGCFCEKLPVPANAPAWARPGGIEHMRVIYAEPGRVLRLSGGLGPLQAEAAGGTLTITLKPTEKGTRILFEYVVGGYMRFPVDEIGPTVDKVMLEQLGRLALKLDPGTARSAVPAGPPAPGGKPAIAGPAVPAIAPARPAPTPGPAAGAGGSGTPAPKSVVGPASAPAAAASRPAAAPVSAAAAPKPSAASSAPAVPAAPPPPVAKPAGPAPAPAGAPVSAPRPGGATAAPPALAPVAPVPPKPAAGTTTAVTSQPQPVLPRAAAPTPLKPVEVAPSAAAAPPPVSAPAATAPGSSAAGSYLERALGLRIEGGAVRLYQQGQAQPLPVAFATPGLEARLAADLAAGERIPANKGKAATCICTGRVETIAGKQVFSVISGKLEFR